MTFRQWRIQQGLSMAEVAARLGYSDKLLYAIEAGHRASRKFLQKFKEIYGVEVTIPGDVHLHESSGAYSTPIPDEMQWDLVAIQVWKNLTADQRKTAIAKALEAGEHPLAIAFIRLEEKISQSGTKSDVKL